MRKYELKARADSMAETRQRIVEATLQLHQTVGPARTSISAIAARAGVQRHTVYSHFPDERSLFAACGGLFAERRPLPDAARLRDIREPRARLRRALAVTYAFFRANEKQLWPVIRDIPLLPDLVGRRFGPYREAVAEAVLAGRGLQGKRRAAVTALLGIALRFETWRALTVDEGLADAEAVDAMSAAIECIASGSSVGGA